MKYPAQGYNATLQTISSANSVPWSVIDSIAIAETAWLSTTGNNATAQLGNPAKKYQTVAAAIAAGAKQLEIGPGTFDFDGTELTAYVRAVSPGRSTLRLAKTGATGEVGLPGNDATEGSNDDGGVGGTGGAGESLTLDLNLRSDRSVNIEIDYAGGAAGAGGPGGAGDGGGNQGPTGDPGSQGVINGTIVLEGCIVGSLSATVADQVTVAIESCNVTTSQPELITQFTNSLVNGVNTEIEETVTAANNAYLRVANGGTVTGPVVSSGANGKIGLPILTTAQRAAQSGRANGDFFIDNATQRATMRISGVDRFTLAAEPFSEYATIRELLRGVREFDPFLGSGQYSTIVAGGGAVTSTQFGRTLVTNNTAGATSRLIWNPGTIPNLGVSIHSVAGVDSRCIPWNRRVILQFRWTASVWRDQNPVSSNITSFGQGVFARVYFGCVGTGSNYTLNVRGIGLHITDQGQMRLVAHNGTTLTESANLGLYFSNGIGLLSESFTIESDGLGAVMLYRNGLLLGTITGGPTTVNTVNQSGVSWEVGNGTSITNVSWGVGMHKIGVF